MQKFKSFLVVSVILSLPLFYFSACSDKADVNAPNQLNFESPQFAVIDYTDILNGVEDATLDSDMTFNNTLANYSFMNSMNSFTTGNPWLMRFDLRKHLGLLFRGLNLTDAQKTQVKDLMVQFHETMKPLVQEFKDANADIIAKANADRKAIVDQVKAGTLTREQAAAQLKTLNQATRDKINANTATIDIKAKMCAARTKLLEDIKGILVGDQLTKFENLIKLIKNPC
jgi:Spy/CpxP family protein refolding chaperone